MQNKMETVEDDKTENLLRPNLTDLVLRCAGQTAACMWCLTDFLVIHVPANFGSDEARK